MHGRGRAGVGLRGTAGPPGLRSPALTPHLQQLASEIDAAGVPLSEFLQLWTQKYGTTLRAADFGEFSVEDLIRRCVSVPSCRLIGSAMLLIGTSK
jgi:hypothetical protein